MPPPISSDEASSGAPPRWLREALALAVPAAMMWFLNRRTLGFWWMGDDPCNVLDAFENGLWRPFFAPVGSFVQPLLSFSLGMDLKLFGLQPQAFYLHQLVSFTVLLAIAYGFLRSFLQPATTCLALALFVTSAPALAVAQQLMNRQYLEGLVLTLASFVCFRRAVVRQQGWLAVLGAGLYLLATAAKEVFVPMILLLPVLVGDSWRDQDLRENLRRAWRYGIPYLLVLGFYGVWRLSLLGWDNSLSAYGALSGDFQSGHLLRRIPRLLGWTEPWQILAGVAVLIAAAWILGRRSTTFAAGLGVTLIVLALPLIPVAGRLASRHLWVATFAAAAMTAAAVDIGTSGLSGPWRARLRALVSTGLVVLGLAALVRAPIRTALEDSSRRYRTEGSFLLDHSRDGMLLTRLPHSHHLQCLSRLGRDFLGQTSGPGFCSDLCYGSRSFPGETFWEAKDERIEAVKRTPGETCDAGRLLAVDMRHDLDGQRLSWELDPIDGGGYQALLLSHEVSPGISFPISIPPQGSLPFRLSEPLRFVLRYRSPDGWRTYSQIHVVDPGGRARPEQPSPRPSPGPPSTPTRGEGASTLPSLVWASWSGGHESPPLPGGGVGGLGWAPPEVGRR